MRTRLNDEGPSFARPSPREVLHGSCLVGEISWKKADLGERRRILLTMLDAVYVDTVEERRIVAIRPRPAFRPLFEVATTRKDSGIVLVSEKDFENADQPPPGGYGVEADSCSWWRRGRIELYREHGIEVLLAAWVASAYPFSGHALLLPYSAVNLLWVNRLHPRQGFPPPFGFRPRCGIPAASSGSWAGTSCDVPATAW